MNVTDTEAQRLLSHARSQLILTPAYGFFGSLSLRLRLVERADIKTAAVDGKNFFYNPQFVRSLTPSVQQSLVAHEVMHCALDHMSRLAERQPKRWNRAADYCINLILHDAGMEIPSDWLLHKQYAGMSADEVYMLLPPDDDDDSSPGPGESGGSMDQLLPSDPSQTETLAVEWKIATIQAATAAKMAGNLPGNLDRFIEEALAPKANWRDHLWKFATQINKDDYAWSRPNRRYLSAGLYLPGLYSENMGPIAIAIDTSGSIDQDTLNMFGTEIRAIIEAVRPSKVHVIYCDADVNHVDEFLPGEPIEFHMYGGGGTDFRPPFAYVEEHEIAPECLVYLTDLYGPFPDEPNYPVMWAATSDLPVPFGEAIRLDA